MIIIRMSQENAERLARAFRMGGEAYEFFDELAISLGSALGISTTTDESDPLDEGIVTDDWIEWEISVNDGLSHKERIIFQ